MKLTLYKTMSDCEESTDEGPCQICMARQTMDNLKEAIERKISLAQLLIDIVLRTLAEVKELTQKPT